MEPVVLVHDTTLTVETTFDWNYQRAFEAEGRPWCTCRGGCSPAFWQQRTGSDFLTALNEGDDGFDDSVVSTVTDQVAFPNLPPRPSSGLRDGLGRYAQMSVQASAASTSPSTSRWAPPTLWLRRRRRRATPRRHRLVRARRPSLLPMRRDARGRPPQAPTHLVRATAQITRAVATSPRTSPEPALPVYAR